MTGKSILFSLGSLVLSTMIFVSCAPESSVPAQPTSPGPSGTLTKEPQWQTEWDRVKEQAKKEGKVVIFTGAGGELRAALTKSIRDKFGIDAEFISGRGNELTAKLFSQRKAGIFMADIYLSGTTTVTDELKPAGVLDPLLPQLILPEVLDPKVWWKGEIPFVDRDKLCLALTAAPYLPIIINTNLIKEEKIRSYRDLLNPELEGKIIMDDPTVAGSGLGTFAVLSYKLLNADFYRQLAKMKPIVTRDKRQPVEWTALGKTIVGFTPLAATFYEFRKAGAPLKGVIPVEGTYIGSSDGNISLINKAPNPNAARVFINWIASKEGGTIFSQLHGYQNARMDVPTDFLDPLSVRQPGVNYFNYIDEDFLLKKPEQVKLAQEIFAPLIK